jgi:tryptophan synthase alpha chain
LNRTLEADRIADAFASHGKRAALMPYLMGGFPDLDTSLELGRALVEAGGDLIELGVPFSDPLADGPVIQAAGQRALERGATFDSVLDAVAAPLAREVPVVLMCYANQLLARGLDGAVSRVAGAGLAGLIVPDLPVDEASELRAACDEAAVALVPLVAPTTPPERVRATAQAARGFVYVVSVTGVTGERSDLRSDLRAVIERVRAQTSLPVAVGFGVATAAQARAVAEIADGVIIGSRLVRAVEEAPTPALGVEAAAALLRETSSALT